MSSSVAELEALQALEAKQQQLKQQQQQQQEETETEEEPQASESEPEQSENDNANDQNDNDNEQSDNDNEEDDNEDNEDEDDEAGEAVGLGDAMSKILQQSVGADAAPILAKRTTARMREIQSAKSETKTARLSAAERRLKEQKDLVVPDHSTQGKDRQLRAIATKGGASCCLLVLVVRTRTDWSFLFASVQWSRCSTPLRSTSTSRASRTRRTPRKVRSCL